MWCSCDTNLLAAWLEGAECGVLILGVATIEVAFPWCKMEALGLTSAWWLAL